MQSKYTYAKKQKNVTYNQKGKAKSTQRDQNM